MCNDSIATCTDDDEFWVVNDLNLRVLTANIPNWDIEEDGDSDQKPNPAPDSNVGWYYDLPLDGERVVSNVIIRSGKVILVTYIPSEEMCGTGGSSVIMEMDACTGGRLTKAQFDITGDGVIDDNDLIIIDYDEFDKPIFAAPTGM